MSDPFTEAWGAIGGGDIRRKEKEAIETARTLSPEEQKLQDAIKALVQQAIKDREVIRSRVLSNLGFKTAIGPDGKQTIQRLTDAERLKLSLTDRTQDLRSQTAKAYAARASAAFEGKTQLPSFLQKDVDAQKTMEADALKNIMGEDFASSAAGQQAVSKLKEREEAARQSVQDMDKSLALTGYNQATSLNNAETGQRIASLGNMTSYIQPTVQAGAGLLGYKQGLRNQQLETELGRLAQKRSQLSSIWQLGGMAGGYGLSQMGSSKPSSPSPGLINSSTGYIPQSYPMG